MPVEHTIDEVWFQQKTVGDFTDSLKARPDALVYFLCNVGDADTQVLLLPEHGDVGHRFGIVVDVFSHRKAGAIVDWATGEGLLSPRHRSQPHGAASGGVERDIALVVATHPHGDHIDGMASFLNHYAHRVDEYWDTGYYHPIGAYHDAMRIIGSNAQIAYSNPTAGYRKWWGNTAITVVGPSIHLRNRYDSYGVDPNDASIVLQVETPVPRVIVRDDQGNRVISGSRNVLLLGGDAQTLSWSHALVDFPRLRKSDSPAAKAIGAAQGDRDLLRAGVHKISHHGSKHGVNLELVERVDAGLTLVSSVGQGGRHGFPHGITQHVLREVVEPLARAGGVHDPKLDPARGIFYTGDRLVNGAGTDVALGTIAVVVRAGKADMWRFGDDPGTDLDLTPATTIWRLRKTVPI